MPDPNQPERENPNASGFMESPELNDAQNAYAFVDRSVTEAEDHMQRFSQTTTYGLFVGIEEYYCKKMHEMEYCVDDAQAVYETFNSSSNKKDLRLLTEKEATRENILNTLNEFLQLVQKGDLFIVYLAAHATIRHNDFFFLPWDAKMKNVLGTGISSTLLINALSTVVMKGVKIILLLDSCQSGGMSFDLSKYKGEKGGGIACFVAASSTEMSYSYEEKGHGYFSYFLVEGLKGGADRDNNGYIMLGELFNYVYLNMDRQIKADRHKIARKNFMMSQIDDIRQSPQLSGTLNGGTVIHQLGNHVMFI